MRHFYFHFACYGGIHLCLVTFSVMLWELIHDYGHCFVGVCRPFFRFGGGGSVAGVLESFAGGTLVPPALEVGAAGGGAAAAGGVGWAAGPYIAWPAVSYSDQE